MSNSKAEPGSRSLSKSIIVGLLLGGSFLLSILIYKELFVILAAAFGALGSWELSTALRVKGWYVPRVPAAVGAALIMPATFFWGEIAQWYFSLIIVASLILWRSIHLLFEKPNRENLVKMTLRDFAAAAFLVIYVPLTMSFSMLLLRRPEDGQWWVLTFVLTVSMIDTFGYLVGRRLGRHKIAPGVSPKKSLEGLVSSILAGSTAAILCVIFLLDAEWWKGVILASALLLAAVLGDLAESLIKRDLGVKDMSSWLPGHGGVMDRLDSILPSALITYLVASLLFG